MGILGLYGSNETVLYGSGSTGLMKESGKVMGEWRSTRESRLFRPAGIAPEDSAHREGR